eukprot:3940321-Rhodomonas_salina.3
MALRAAYAMSGTDVGYATPTVLRTGYAMSGTEVGFATVLSCASAMRCPVLTWAMTLRCGPDTVGDT